MHKTIKQQIVVGVIVGVILLGISRATAPQRPTAQPAGIMV